jgi:hypothetical protein
MFEVGSYLEKKAKGDVSVKKKDNVITIEFYDYSIKTGEKLGPQKRDFFLSDLIALRERLQKRIDNINTLILDAEKTVGG